MTLRITLLRVERELTQREIAPAADEPRYLETMLGTAPSTLLRTVQRHNAVNEIARLADDRGAAGRRP